MMPRFTSIPEIVGHVRGKFSHMVFLGADYTITDLITDLEDIDEHNVVGPHGRCVHGEKDETDKG